MSESTRVDTNRERRWKASAAAAAILLPFLALALTTILNHELWRDELEIWLIARDSPALSDLMTHIATQPHPALWYLLVWGLARFAADPLALQMLNLAIGAGAALVFCRYAPFSALQRALFCLGYYALYEYTVISRTYSLELLLLFSVTALFARRRRIGAAEALLLVLLANTDLYGAIAAAQFVLLALLLELPPRRARRLWTEPRAALPLLAVLAGVALSLGQILRGSLDLSPDHAGAYVPGYDLDWLLSGLAAVARGVVPLQDPTTIHSWNSTFLALLPAPLASIAGALLGAGFLVLGVAALRRRPALLAVFLLGTGAMLGVTLFFWYGYARHHGQFFLWLLCCAWLARALPQGERSSCPGRRRGGWGSALSATLTVVLLLQALACAWAVVQDVARPFSQSRAVGTALRGEEFDGTILVGSIDYAAQPVAAYVERPIWYPESERFGTFVDWSARRRMVPVEKVLQDALSLFEERGRDVVLVLNQTPSIAPGQRLALGQNGELVYLAAFTGAIVPDENYHLYRLRPRRPPA